MYIVIMIINVILNFTNFCVVVVAEVVAKPLILGMLPSTSLILELKSVFLTKRLTRFFLSASLFFFSSQIYQHHM